jgi:hypothetical protein
MRRLRTSPHRVGLPDLLEGRTAPARDQRFVDAPETLRRSDFEAGSGCGREHGFGFGWPAVAPSLAEEHERRPGCRTTRRGADRRRVGDE